jgi:hypothetical protein
MWFSSLFVNVGVPRIKHVVIYDNNQKLHIFNNKKPKFSCSNEAYWNASWFGVEKN